MTHNMLSLTGTLITLPPHSRDSNLRGAVAVLLTLSVYASAHQTQRGVTHGQRQDSAATADRTEQMTVVVLYVTHSKSHCHHKSDHSSCVQSFYFVSPACKTDHNAYTDTLQQLELANTDTMQTEHCYH
jgi:hypothetical protein